MAQSQSIIFFDGDCNLCNGFVQFVLKNETSSDYQFCSLQSDYAIKFFKQTQFNSIGIDSVIVFENNQFYLQSEAAFKVINKLNWPFKLIIVFSVLPKFFNNFIYQFIAKYRYKIFGKTTVCWVMKEVLKPRFLI